MLALLGRDGRAPYAQIAAEIGWTATRVARRMAELVESLVLFFDLEFATERMGYAVRAALWLRARPADLHAVGTTMATHPEIVFIAATTGPTNLMASLMCRDTAHLYRYVTQRLGALDGITGDARNVGIQAGADVAGQRSDFAGAVKGWVSARKRGCDRP